MLKIDKDDKVKIVIMCKTLISVEQKINNCRISTCSALAAWPAPLLKAHTDRSWHRRGGLQLSATSVTSEQKI
jgi:hypothetical protein